VLLLGSLLDGAHLAAPDDLPHVIDRAAAVCGWSATVYMVDYEQRVLRSLRSDDPDEPVDDSMAGACFRTLQLSRSGAIEGRPVLWVPLLDGAERLGAIRLTLAPHEVPDDVLERIQWFGHLVGHLIASKSPYGDILQRVRESRPRTVASELIWSLLPPLTMACEGLVISGMLAPTHTVAGDAFDYAVGDGLAHVGIIDATGHDLQSGMIGAAVLAAYRNARRQRATGGLAATTRSMDGVLRQIGLDTFATGVFGQLDINTGAFHYVNAGHPFPLLVRSGRVVGELTGGRRPLLGLEPSHVAPSVEALEPGDWIVLYTDGVTEARDPARRFFGIDRLVATIERCAAHDERAPEALRKITDAVLEHQGGALQDDATMLIVQWVTGEEHRMRAVTRL
jgi:hypothetical protein